MMQMLELCRQVQIGLSPREWGQEQFKGAQSVANAAQSKFGLLVIHPRKHARHIQRGPGLSLYCSGCKLAAMNNWGTLFQAFSQYKCSIPAGSSTSDQADNL